MHKISAMEARVWGLNWGELGVVFWEGFWKDIALDGALDKFGGGGPFLCWDGGVGRGFPKVAPRF